VIIQKEMGVEIVLTNEKTFDFNSSEYASLYSDSHATAFQAPLWLAGIHETVMPRIEAEPITIVGRSRAGRLVLLVPLMRRRHLGLCKVEFAGGDLCDYQGAIYRDSEIDLLLNDKTMSERISDHLRPCDFIKLDKLAENDLVLRALFPNVREAPMRVGTYRSALGPEWRRWRAGNIDPDFQRYLERKRRRLGRTGELRFCVVEDEHELGRIFENSRRFRISRFRELQARDITAQDEVFEFYRKTAIEAARHGTACTFCLYVGNHPVAVIFGLRDHETFWLVWLAFDNVQYRRHSVGLLATEDAIRTCILMRLSTFDFTIGDHPYKMHFGGRKLPLLEWHIPRNVRGYVAVVVLAFVREAKRVLRRWLKSEGDWGKPIRGRLGGQLAELMRRHLSRDQRQGRGPADERHLNRDQRQTRDVADEPAGADIVHDAGDARRIGRVRRRAR
jgi:CelD/BcsL family acetyltransferase involved in cellulose biosynthesis